MPLIDYTEGVVEPLGISAEGGGVWANTDFTYDFAIGGTPFLSAARDDFPYTRRFANSKRDQLDTASVAGEQSLSNWWLRSQFDWSGGAGQELYEPATSETVRSRFHSSQGVDVWTPGQVTLLRSVASVVATAGCVIAGGRSGSTDYIVYATGAVTKKWDGTTLTTITGLTAQPSWLWSIGDKVLACHATGIDIIDLSGSTGTALRTGAASAPKAWWVKQRIIAAVGRSLYECALPNPIASAAMPAALYSHPDSSWTWTAVVEVPGAILAAGYAGGKGAVYRFELTDAGATPTLSAAITTAEFPQGEWPTGMIAYLGTFVVIGTNKGVRVATVTSERGDISYGPLTVESATAVQHFTAHDRFVYAGVTAGQADGTSGLVRIDLSNPDETGRFAYAHDLSSTDTGTVTGVTHLGSSGRKVVATSQVWCESATDLVASGWFQTSKVLFGTLEPKVFRLARSVATVPGGSLSVAAVSPDGTETSMWATGETADVELAVPQAIGPVSRLALKFTLESDGDDGPSFTGWQLKALPAVARKELLQVPLLCYKHEQDRRGNKRQRDPWERFTDLRDACADSDVTTFQDLNTGESVACIVEDVNFTQLSPPGTSEGFGGIIQLVLRQL